MKVNFLWKFLSKLQNFSIKQLSLLNHTILNMINSVMFKKIVYFTYFYPKNKKIVTDFSYHNSSSFMGRSKGIEPLHAGATIRCVNRFTKIAMNGRGSRIRTHIYGFGDRCSTIELYPFTLLYDYNKYT